MSSDFEVSHPARPPSPFLFVRTALLTVLMSTVLAACGSSDANTPEKPIDGACSVKDPNMRCAP